jgi:hypothetical protein
MCEREAAQTAESASQGHASSEEQGKAEGRAQDAQQRASSPSHGSASRRSPAAAIEVLSEDAQLSILRFLPPADLLNACLAFPLVLSAPKREWARLFCWWEKPGGLRFRQLL